MRLDKFQNNNFDRGASLFREIGWVLVSGVFFESWLPGSWWRVTLLRLFGARIGKSVVIKPGIKVKFPWRLSVGDHSWLGERVWIENLADVTIGCHACISQGAFLCTGSHDWNSPNFDLIVTPITVSDHAWICAFATVAPGGWIGEGAVVTMGKNVTGRVDDWSISGVAKTERRRTDRDSN